jgi:hypothetical protein
MCELYNLFIRLCNYKREKGSNFSPLINTKIEGGKNQFYPQILRRLGKFIRN